MNLKNYKEIFANINIMVPPEVSQTYFVIITMNILFELFIRPCAYKWKLQGYKVCF